MPDNVVEPEPASQKPAVPKTEITLAQRDDLVTLFARHITEGNIEGLGDRGLGALNAVADLRIPNQSPKDFARAVIERLHEKGKLGEVVAIVMTEASRDGILLGGLNHVMAGGRLADFDALQAVVQAREDPFLDNVFLEDVYPRIRRTVCAIGLGNAQNINELRGTGFLVGPDLLMTNYHVVEPYVTASTDTAGEIAYSEKETGDNIFCFFDYLAAPQPEVPPIRPHGSVVIKAARTGWLEYAREKLAKDGHFPYPDAAQVARRFDYAIIRLEREIGKVPCRKSGGAPRGWVELSTGNSADLLRERRVIVVQHPEGSHQLFDIGEFDRIDPSATRVWYAVNTGFGSSGSAAIDKKGRLCALHNAQVKAANNTDPLEVNRRRVNQGVRIDKILDDLARQPKPWVPTPPPKDGDLGYWSLTDSIEHAKPIIGRQFFRETVLKMMKPDGDRLLTVVGEPGSGRRFSMALLKRVVGMNVPVIEFSPGDLLQLSPEDFLTTLKRQLMLPDTGRNIPDRNQPSVSLSRWLNFELPNWLAEALNAGQRSDPARYPCWIVINTIGEKTNVGDKDTPPKWHSDLFELIAALTGGHDTAHPNIDTPQLRWLMLGSKIGLFPPTRWTRIVDDLERPPNIDYAQEYADCMSLAWLALEREDQGIPTNFLKKLAKRVIAVAKKENVRTALATEVCENLR